MWCTHGVDRRAAADRAFPFLYSSARHSHTVSTNQWPQPIGMTAPSLFSFLWVANEVARLAEKRRNDPVGAAALLRLRDNGGDGILEPSWYAEYLANQSWKQRCHVTLVIKA
jgi:hypothetical protein